MKRYPAWLVVFGSALWGTDALFRRPLTQGLSPLTIVLLEHCVLCIMMMPVLARYRREFARLTRRELAALLWIALGGSLAATSLFTFSMKYGNPSVVMLLQKMQPLFAVGLACLLLGERPVRGFWPCCTAGIAGAVLISAPDWRAMSLIQSGQPAVIAGAVGAAALWGSATVFGRYAVSRLSPTFVTAMRFLFALPALALLFFLQKDSQRQLPQDADSAATILALAVIPGLVALLLYYKGLKSTPATTAAVCELAFPLSAVILNRVILNVQLLPVQALGAVILVASVTALAILEARNHPAISFSPAKPSAP